MPSIRKYDIDLQNNRQLLSKFGQSHRGRNGSKLAKKASWGASGAPSGPNVGEESYEVLLFRILCVVLLLLVISH